MSRRSKNMDSTARGAPEGDSERLSVLKILSLTCDQSTQLTSAGLDRPLTRGERVALRLHHGICGSCRKMKRQFLLLRRANEALREGESVPARSKGLSAGARTQIREAMTKKI